MNASLFVVYQVCTEAPNDFGDETKIIGIYTSHENAIKQMVYILQKEYERFIINKNIEYSVTQWHKIYNQHMNQLNKNRICNSISSGGLEYQIYECNETNKIVGLQD